MAKHPVPKYKTTASKTRRRHSMFMQRTRLKLMGMVQKMKNLEIKGNLKLREKAPKKAAKVVKV